MSLFQRGIPENEICSKAAERDGEIAQSIKPLPFLHKDPGSISRTQNFKARHDDTCLYAQCWRRQEDH